MAGFAGDRDCPGDGGTSLWGSLGIIFILTVLILIVALILSGVWFCLDI